MTQTVHVFNGPHPDLPGTRGPQAYGLVPNAVAARAVMCGPGVQGCALALDGLAPW